MAEDLEDGVFWLPSQFLTDDDILMDFSSGSDLNLPSSGSLTTSTETESDTDDSLSGLAHQLARCSLHSEGLVLSTSPQSTLCGCVGKDGSSLGSPNPPVSPPPTAEKDGGATWDLLHKAAGEVARFKLRTEKPAASAGTGFFDCSNKGLFCPPPRTTPFYAQPPQLSLLSQLQQIRQQQQQMLKPQFNRSTRSKSPLGLPASAWPPLQAQNQPVQVVAPMFMGQNGTKRESVGTGVFLPRRVASPAGSRKKSEGNPTKMRSGKGSQSHRRGSRPPTANPIAFQLPQEWTY